MIENYDDMEWDINPFPIGSSTPDEFYELSYRASTHCPNCNNPIDGTAQFWSRTEDMANMWLERIDYDYCECELGSEEENWDADEWKFLD